MIIEYMDEFIDEVPQLYPKQVRWFDKYLVENGVDCSCVYDCIDVWADTTPYSAKTKQRYRSAMRRYVELVSEKYWRGYMNDY